MLRGCTARTTALPSLLGAQSQAADSLTVSLAYDEAHPKLRRFPEQMHMIYSMQPAAAHSEPTTTGRAQQSAQSRACKAGEPRQLTCVLHQAHHYGACKAWRAEAGRAKHGSPGCSLACCTRPTMLHASTSPLHRSCSCSLWVKDFRATSMHCIHHPVGKEGLAQGRVHERQYGPKARSSPWKPHPRPGWRQPPTSHSAATPRQAAALRALSSAGQGTHPQSARAPKLRSLPGRSSSTALRTPRADASLHPPSA
jgi:hypothetical protein